MTCVLKSVPVILLAISAFAQSGGSAEPPINMTVTTPGGTANYISLFSKKNTIVNSHIVQKGGNVGIGTTAPSSPLTVNGAIQSLAVGFMFPDKSVQSSAGLVNVTHDATMVGNGLSSSPLGLANPLSITAAGSTTPLQVTNPNGGGAIFAQDSGNSANGVGLFATSNNGTAVFAAGESTNSIGVEGADDSAGGIGVLGFGVIGTSWAGYFNGDVNVTGNISKAGGSFKIDDPLDPANKYLYHSFVESPDMKDMYDGTVTTDAAGNATIQLPKWFQALNRSFRYQLTTIGQFAQAIVATEVEHNQFTIKTDKPNVKVSWQVTGTRHDAWANAHRIPVEVEKPKEERGYYIHPELFDQGQDKSILAAHRPDMFGPDGVIVPKK
jgi:hypothetical protein